MSPEIKFKPGWANHPQKAKLTQEVQEWVAKTDPIPGLQPGKKPAWIELGAHRLDDVQKCYGWYEGVENADYQLKGAPAFGGGLSIPLSFIPQKPY